MLRTRAHRKEEGLNYTKILKRAAEITWRHKALWLFGFLLALISAADAGGRGGQGVQYVFGPGDRLQAGAVLAMIAAVVLVVLALVVMAIIVSYVSRGALIGMVREAEETGSTSARSGWRIGWSRFPRMFGIGLVTGIPAAVTALGLVILGLSPLVLLLARTRTLTVLAIVMTVLSMLLVIGLLFVASVALSVVLELAHRQCILEARGVLDSIRDGYRLARQNLRHAGVVWLLLFGADLAVGIVLAPLFLLLFAVTAASTAAVYTATTAVAPTLLVGIASATPGLLLLAMLGGVYQVFRSATWTLAYMELKLPTQPLT